ncbi:hypothetical protein [Paenibacillus sp. WC2504]|uniref:hypothetical protein n=1 Tax=Paenibacillus sp. WC2504 TaxID=3461403 RepID=UPI004045A4BF
MWECSAGIAVLGIMAAQRVAIRSGMARWGSTRCSKERYDAMQLERYSTASLTV